MKKCMLGRKLGMTQIFNEDGVVIPVTVISAGPLTVIRKKTEEVDGYNAIQVGFEDIPERKVNKPLKGLFEKAKVLRETQPRPEVSHGLGMACATQAIEYVRIYNVADWLWLERERNKQAPPLPYLPFKVRIYAWLIRVAYPLYNWGKRRGWRWLNTLKDFVKLRLLKE